MPTIIKVRRILCAIHSKSDILTRKWKFTNITYVVGLCPHPCDIAPFPFYVINKNQTNKQNKKH